MLFQELEEFRKAGNLVVLTALGRLFKMYAQRMKAQQTGLSEDIYCFRGQGNYKLQRALQVTSLAIPAIIIMPAYELDIHGKLNFEYGDVLIENRMQFIQ